MEVLNSCTDCISSIFCRVCPNWMFGCRCQRWSIVIAARSSNLVVLQRTTGYFRNVAGVLVPEVMEAGDVDIFDVCNVLEVEGHFLDRIASTSAKHIIFIINFSNRTTRGIKCTTL
jgi:hypothetical protein